MKRRVRIQPVVRLEILEAIEYLESKQEGLGRRLKGSIRTAIRSIQEHPLRYPIFVNQFHKYRVTPFQYGIIYSIDIDGTVVLGGFIHLMQDPKRWKRRFGK